MSILVLERRWRIKPPENELRLYATKYRRLKALPRHGRPRQQHGAYPVRQVPLLGHQGPMPEPRIAWIESAAPHVVPVLDRDKGSVDSFQVSEVRCAYCDYAVIAQFPSLIRHLEQEHGVTA
ncbi:MAG: hypothetical protein KGY81_07535 [Phycisphaerae bacterium]|nr:hypothetical protein [Phycisphaerae bacterium]